MINIKCSEQGSLTSDFCQNLIDLNALNRFSHWYFYTGMLFGKTEIWWGNGGNRPGHHEGLDICFYVSTKGDLCKLDESTLVPVMFDGVVYEISDDDFLGKSVFIRHDVRDHNGWFLHTVYAHTDPVADLKPGANVNAGDCIAKLADIRQRNLALPAHLHLSVVWLPDKHSADLLKWNIMGKSNEARFADPFLFINIKYSEASYIPLKK